MDANDWRQGFPEFAEPALSRNLALRTPWPRSPGATA